MVHRAVIGDAAERDAHAEGQLATEQHARTTARDALDDASAELAVEVAERLARNLLGPGLASLRVRSSSSGTLTPASRASTISTSTVEHRRVVDRAAGRGPSSTISATSEYRVTPASASDEPSATAVPTPGKTAGAAVTAPIAADILALRRTRCARKRSSARSGYRRRSTSTPAASAGRAAAPRCRSRLRSDRRGARPARQRHGRSRFSPPCGRRIQGA